MLTISRNISSLIFSLFLLNLFLRQLPSNRFDSLPQWSVRARVLTQMSEVWIWSWFADTWAHRSRGCGRHSLQTPYGRSKWQDRLYLFKVHYSTYLSLFSLSLFLFHVSLYSFFDYFILNTLRPNQSGCEHVFLPSTRWCWAASRRAASAWVRSFPSPRSSRHNATRQSLTRPTARASRPVTSSSAPCHQSLQSREDFGMMGGTWYRTADACRTHSESKLL